MGNVSLISRNVLENQQYICDEYLEGKSIKSLIEEFNSSHRTIRSILESNKVTIRSRGLLNQEEKSLRLKNIQKYAQEHGGVCLEDEYVNNDTQMWFRCSCGYEWQTRARTLTHSMAWCPECAGNALVKAKQFREIIAESGLELLSELVDGTRQRIYLRCKNGHEFDVGGNSLLYPHTGVTCPICRKMDLAGMRFGKLVVLHEVDSRSRLQDRYWLCKCDCGVETKVYMGSLTKPKFPTISCGCLGKMRLQESHLRRREAADITGQEFGYLKVVKKLDELDKWGSSQWLCSCQCGNEKVISRGKLVSGHDKSCGCRGVTEEDRINYMIGRKLRSRVSAAIRSQSVAKKGKTVDLIGCDIPTLRKHIEDQFEPWMTWENWGLNTWHIDHIRPIASFDLSDPEQKMQCFHYRNLQPLSASENFKKSKKWV